MALLDRVIDSRLPLLAVTALAGGAFLIVGAGGRGAGSAQAALAEELARGQRLDSRCQERLPRLYARQRVARAVIAGRMTLLEAAAHVRALDRMPPALDWDVFRRAHQGA